ncbi:DUF6377 domain-containing protein [Parabacteroides pacaensis]|uniref:DUF6377 domain-containing protein n=1 Tax=Parabacteroides pacaensis TaxID=2086575 RepID=UPI000D10B495|nr:DUF6377 domain-containing protein [Parabacteroides pacaensis]
MRCTLILLLFIWYSVSCWGGNEIDSLLTELDQTLLHRNTYIKEKELRISSLKESLDKPSVFPEQKYSINTRLFEEYTKYICDSAFHYIDQNLKICKDLYNGEWATDTKLNLSYLLSTIGLGKESLDNLATIDSRSLLNYQKSRYYQSYQQAYNCLADYASGTKYAMGYYHIAGIYKDSAIMFMDTASYEYKLEISRKMLSVGKREEAKEFLLDYMGNFKSGSKEYAVLANQVASIYGGDGDIENRKKYLILSALSDIKGAIRENSSLRELAILLYENGEIDKAYEYMKYSKEDANFYNARLRSIQISRIQPIIDKAYQTKNVKQRQSLQLYLLFISILSVFLFIAILYIYRQIKKLSKARKELHDANIKLKELNCNLSKANEQQKELNEDLKEANNRLADLNQELCEANHIKEEYIGHFLDLCSTYIDKLEDYRKLVNRKVSSGQIEDLFKLTKSSHIIDAELKEFYMNFDTTFLKLYPTFVQEFNALLAESEQFTLRKGELLNTELRIFALIRLGINDSSKIANFLRYSAQTIYNYRTKVKNKALGSRDEFEENVMKIGSFIS